MAQKTLTALAATICMYSFSPILSSPTPGNYTLAEARVVKKFELEEALRRFERKKDLIIKQNPGLKQIEAEALLDRQEHFGTLPIWVDFFEPKANAMYLGPKVFSPQEIFTNKEVWMSLSWRNWDQIPMPLRSLGLERIFSELEYVLDKRLEDFSDQELDTMPKPILTYHYVRELSYWSDYYNSKKNLEEKRAIKNTLLAIMLAESYASREVANHWQGQKNFADIGVMQLNKSTIQTLRKKNEFRQHLLEDFNHPALSIRAGAYWFTKIYDESDLDLDLAIRSYNVGRQGAKAKTKKSVEYQSNVKDRLDRYVLGDESYAWNYICVQATIRQL